MPCPMFAKKNMIVAYTARARAAAGSISPVTARCFCMSGVATRFMSRANRKIRNAYLCSSAKRELSIS